MYLISAQTGKFDFLDQICPRRVFPAKNGKSEITTLNSANSNYSMYRISFKWQFCFLFLFFFDQIWPKRVFPAEKGKIVLVRGSMVVTYYITIFRTGANRHNGSLMSLLLLVAGTIYSNNENNKKSIKSYNVNEVFTETWFVMPKRKCCVTPS